MKKEHILVIRFSALGDVAMAVPVVWSLARQYPDLRITVLSRGFARPLFDGIAPNVGFMEADLKGENHGLRGLNRLYRRLAAKQFTAVADLHNVLRSEFLRLRFNLGHLPVAHIDKHRKGRRQLTTATHKRMVQQPTSFEKYADVFAKLGYPVKVQFHSIFSEGKGDLSTLVPQLSDWLNRTDQGPTTLSASLNIGIAPFAAHPGKVYPTEMMEQVIGMLTQQHPEANIFLFGRGKDEERYFNQWCSRWPQCVNVSSMLQNIREELVLMSHLQVMLSMDSSNMHLASLTATPVVSIWGATHPYAGFMGWGQPADSAVQTELDCRPCSIYGQKACRRGDLACMRMIKPETIVDRINHIITH